MATLQANENDQYSEQLQSVFDENDAVLEPGDRQDLEDDPPKEPSFPIFIFAVAVTKDIADVLLDLTGAGAFVASLVSIVSSLILFFWILLKGGRTSGAMKKNLEKVQKKAWGRLLVSSIVEAIPFLQIVPTATLFVLDVHSQEKKVARSLMEASAQT